MPSKDYANAVGGGLKLKGVKDSGIDKKKKKKKKEKSKELVQTEDSILRDEDAPVPKSEEGSSSVQKALADEEEVADDGGDLVKQQDTEIKQYGKTEAQRRHEERRRKRLDERLKREGVKTHKERVEELNKYLSNLSEHHDMPRIGPG